MATHSSVLVWRIPGTGEPSGLPSVGSHRVGHELSDLAAAAAAWGKEKNKDDRSLAWTIGKMELLFTKIRGKCGNRFEGR